MARVRLGIVVAASWLALAAGCGKRSTGADAPVHVSAASDLSAAFDEVGKAFTAKTGRKVQIDYGSTGQIATQIAEGAPVDLFASADRKNVDKVIAAGRCDGATAAAYGQGRLVLWVKKGGTAPADLAGLTDPRFARIAIANPDHAPYGIAARDALQRAGLWDQLQARIVIGENIRATLQYAQTGNADVGIVARSLALASDGVYTEVPATAHAPIDQTLVVCGTGAAAAGGKAFADFVASPEGTAIMARYGFVRP